MEADALFTQTRPGGAPDPVVRTDNSADESNTHYWKLIRRADQAEQVGNSVRAAILRTQAARVYRALDPEGHVWNFDQNIEDVSIADMEKASGLTIKTSLEG